VPAADILPPLHHPAAGQFDVDQHTLAAGERMLVDFMLGVASQLQARGKSAVLSLEGLTADAAVRGPAGRGKPSRSRRAAMATQRAEAARSAVAAVRRGDRSGGTRSVASRLSYSSSSSPSTMLAGTVPVTGLMETVSPVLAKMMLTLNVCAPAAWSAALAGA
jgi:hypothetical protein